MATPTTADELLKLIRKSGLLDDARLDTYLTRLQSSGLIPEEPRKLAGLFVRDGLLTYFQAEQFLLGKWRGFTIGKYKLLERIGFGGMGQVFLCEHSFMRKRVAIKVLPPAKAEDPASLGRFYREARAAGSLDHPNIVRTHDIDQDGPLHFLVMEYVDGTSLLDIVKRNGPMDILRACHYIRQAADGLQYASQMGIIHRDIKPGNILVDRTGVAKILDMGLARFYNDTNDLLTLKYDEKSVLGTADYVAPEQTINSHDVDTRADIYGLGCTFYFLLAGHPPFPEGSVSQKLLWHQTKLPTSIRDLRPQVSRELEAVLNRMLAKDLRHRFQTATEVSNALEPFTRTAIPPPPTEEMPKLSPAAMEQNASTASPMGTSAIRAESMQRPASSAGFTLPPDPVPLSATPPSGNPPPSVVVTRDMFFQKPPSSNVLKKELAQAGSLATSEAESPVKAPTPTPPQRAIPSVSEQTPVTRPQSLPMFVMPEVQAPPVVPSKANPIKPVLMVVAALLIGGALGMLIWFKLPANNQPASPIVPSGDTNKK